MKNYDLTYPQKRVWYTEKIDPNTSINNLGGFVEIRGEFDPQKLKRAIEVLINNCSTFNIQIHEDDGVPYLYKESTDFSVEIMEFNSKNESIDWMKKNFKLPFKLDKSFLFHFNVIKINKSLGGYFIKLHHLIADGWSFQIITKTIANLYNKLLNKERIDESFFNNLNYDYKRRENEYLFSERFRKDEQFWSKSFSEKHYSYRRKNPSSYSINRGNRLKFKIDTEKSKKIDRLISKLGISANSFFVALFSVYFYKVTNINDITIGNPILNRLGKKEKKSIGMYTSTMPFRFTIDGKLDVNDFLKAVNKKLNSSIKHQQYPYQLLKTNQKSNEALFDVAVNYYNTSLINEINNHTIINHEFYNGVQWIPLEIIVKKWSNDCYELMLDYDITIYSEKKMKSMYYAMEYLINEFIDESNNQIDEFTLSKFNVRDNDKVKGLSYLSIIDMFENQAFLNPSKIAILDKKKYYTYFDLYEKVNSFASYLKNMGVGAGEKIAIKLNNSIETIVGILAVLKIGSAFIPIDIDIPKNRLRFIIQDSACDFLITKNYNDNNCELENMVTLIDIEKATDELNYNNKFENSNKNYFTQHSLAYIIYTSGSTGKPKGVMINHNNISNYIQWASSNYLNQEEKIETFAFYSNIGFDLTLTSIFVPLVTGNRISIYDSKSSIDSLKRIFVDNSTTVVKLTPSHLRLIDESSLINSKLRLLIVGGEHFSTSLAKRISEISNHTIRIVNEYGPTEATIGCIAHTYDFYLDNDITVPIGHPIPNTKAYILNEQLCEVEKGEVGFLFLGGLQLSSGYINNIQQNESRFINSPFLENEILFKTDDLCRIDSNDNIVYVGRKDRQVKVQGNRVELDEVEINLSKFVKNSEVFVQDFVEDNINFLVAFIETNELIDKDLLIDKLNSELPTYMLPKDLFTLDKFPITKNGKKDISKINQLYYTYSNSSKEDFKENNFEKKRLVLDVFQKVLDLEEINSNDNYFHLGGDSIKAIQISAKLQKIGVQLKVKDLLNNPVLGDALQYITHIDTNNKHEFKTVTGEFPLTPIADWFVNSGFNNIHYWHQSISLKFTEKVSVDTLVKNIQMIYKYHDGLRLNYNPEKNNLFYNNRIDENVTSFYDLSIKPFNSSKDIIKTITEEHKSSFNIYENQLFKVLIFKFSDSIILVMIGHHLVVDVVSWKVILEDLYSMMKSNSYSPSKSMSIKNWSEYIAESGNSDDLIKNNHNIAYLHGSLKVDFNKGQDLLRNSELMSASMSRKETELLLKEANIAYNTNAYHLLISSLFLTIYKNGLGQDMTLLLEDHGRTNLKDVDVLRTVGWLTSIHPISYSLNSKKSLATLLKEVKEIMINSSKHFNFPNTITDEECFILFNYLGVLNDNETANLFEIIEIDTGEDISIDNQMISPIEINAFVNNNKLKFNVRYSKNKFNRTTISDFLNRLKIVLFEIISHCISQQSIEYTPSDFDTINLTQEELDSLFE
ncbi:amino acid adenylation domain-containing protein [Virgibacillus sp. NKC19-3]|uniref:non-ribosomal peptide synthetase n=1 Tax=Virgibacillus saliphilus TaxID=2831674 RepID=UPI001C9B3997|nr:non-ribosomal peptide synthetase [Virgibacillus sp. NKC19-3]MBY7142474.1 amino acid adenylation domain-containing protein [Virgibacillus sp. NKC19-3]